MKKGRHEGLEKDAEEGGKAIISKERHTMNEKERTGRNITEQNRTYQNTTEQNRTEQNRTKYSRTEWNIAENTG
jgi:hypothetical protein